MAPGFIHDKLDLKLLILYIMSRAEGEIDLAALTDLTFCDDGIDYFTFAEVVGDLVRSGHLQLQDGIYSITERGRTNGAIMESSLSGVVRSRCDRILRDFNAQVRRRAQITALVETTEKGRFLVNLGLQDGEGPIFSLTLPVASQERGEALARRFRQEPEALFSQILSLLAHETEEVD